MLTKIITEAEIIGAMSEAVSARRESFHPSGGYRITHGSSGMVAQIELDPAVFTAAETQDACKRWLLSIGLVAMGDVKFAKTDGETTGTVEVEPAPAKRTRGPNKPKTPPAAPAAAEA